MIPCQFPEANVKANKPEEMKEEDCAALPVWKGVQNLPSGATYPCFISYWMPTPEELADLNAGKGIYLAIISNGLPPVQLYTHNPFVQLNANGS